MACRKCGCSPNNPWYCEDCDNPKCPCGQQNEEEDDNNEANG